MDTASQIQCKIHFACSWWLCLFCTWLWKVPSVSFGMEIFVQWIKYPTVSWKTLDPSRLMVFLGVELSSVDMEARLPAEKLDKYREKLTDLAKQRKTTLENMQSVIGCLQFATSVIIPGRAFVRRLIDTTTGVKKPSHFVTLNDGTTADIKMWLTFFQVSQWENNIHSARSRVFHFTSHVYWRIKTSMCSNF